MQHSKLEPAPEDGPDPLPEPLPEVTPPLPEVVSDLPPSPPPPSPPQPTATTIAIAPTAPTKPTKRVNIVRSSEERGRDAWAPATTPAEARPIGGPRRSAHGEDALGSDV